MDQPNSHLLSTREAAQRLGIHPTTLTRAVHRGLIIPARVTPGGFLRFSEEELQRFLSERIRRLARSPGAEGGP